MSISHLVNLGKEIDFLHVWLDIESLETTWASGGKDILIQDLLTHIRMLASSLRWRHPS